MLATICRILRQAQQCLKQMLGIKKCYFTFKKSDLRYGQKILKKLGMPKDAWFVAFHYREGGFYESVPFWEANYSNRCVDVWSYQQALEEVTRLGGYAFRVAARNSVRLPRMIRSIPKLFDIDMIDGDIERFTVFLLSQSRFFLCCNSGPSIIAGYFGVPAAQSQTAPFYGAPIHHFDLFIFKRYKNISENKILAIREMMLAPYGHIRLDACFQKNNIAVLDNTSEEVLMLVKEMLIQTDPSSITLENKHNLSRYTSNQVYCLKGASRISKYFFENFQTEPTKELSSIFLDYDSSTIA